jgi:acetate---CoA ligase (ADP-forming)
LDNRIQQALNPSSIMVVGASSNSAKRGNVALRYLSINGYQGEVYPVNPHTEVIHGYTCYRSIAAVAKPVDLAIICTPAETVAQILSECGNIGCAGAVILAGGFAETGSEGEKLQEEVLEVARKQGIRVIGPNTSGLFNTHYRANLVGYDGLQAGSIGILSQSGNMALAFVTEGLLRGVGFSTYVGVGNEADIQFHEYLDYFKEDDNTKVVIAYVEGFSQGIDFIEKIRAFVRNKPLVVYKTGRTQAGKNAVVSHTGALAGNYKVAREVMRHAGAVVVEQSDLVLPVASAFTSLPFASSNRIAVLTDGGGQGTIAADALVERGLKLPELKIDTVSKLKSRLPVTASLNNPVDVAGAADQFPSVISDCAGILLKDPGIDALIIVGLFGGYHHRFSSELLSAELDAFKTLRDHIDHSTKPVILHSIYAGYPLETWQIAQQMNLPVYGSIEDAAASMKALVDYGETRKNSQAVQARMELQSKIPPTEIVVSDPENDNNRFTLTEPEARECLSNYGLTMPSSVVVENIEKVEKLESQWFEQAVAIKVVSRDIVHKSDSGGIALSVQGKDEIVKSIQQIGARVKKHSPNAKIDGYLLLPMTPPGLEVIVGCYRDPQFGPVIMFGLGGIHVEVLKDVVFRSAPLSKEEALKMVMEIRAANILQGVRGSRALDLESLTLLVHQLGNFISAYPSVEEVDLNPVFLYEEGLFVADSRVITKSDPESTELCCKKENLVKESLRC